MKNITLVLIPVLILGVFVSIQKPQQQVIHKQIECPVDTLQYEYNCKLQNYSLLWSKKNIL